MRDVSLAQLRRRRRSFRDRLPSPSYSPIRVVDELLQVPTVGCLHDEVRVPGILTELEQLNNVRMVGVLQVPELELDSPEDIVRGHVASLLHLLPVDPLHGLQVASCVVPHKEDLREGSDAQRRIHEGVPFEARLESPEPGHLQLVHAQALDALLRKLLEAQLRHVQGPPEDHPPLRAPVHPVRVQGVDMLFQACEIERELLCAGVRHLELVDGVVASLRPVVPVHPQRAHVAARVAQSEEEVRRELVVARRSGE
mmetsp:Transcript_30526/g.88075  ORF Transcript_30526/g.88075 Transcript_30526/m.88075 type:complete len:255 (-) Transcript_30526:680-1444(-)